MLQFVQVGLKNADDYGSDANTDDLANDSDLDTSTRESCTIKYFLLQNSGLEIFYSVKQICSQLAI